MLVSERTVSKILRHSKSIFCSTHSDTLAYRPNLSFYLLILIFNLTVKSSLLKKKRLASRMYFFPQYLGFSTHFGTLVFYFCKKLVLASRVLFTLLVYF